MTKQVSDTETEIDLHAHEYYVNRELSHLQFNKRVLKQATDTSHPLLNRMMFCCIFSSNMDEFFEIRAAGLKHQIKYGRETIGPDGLTPLQTLDAINHIAHDLVAEQYGMLNEVLLPEFAEELSLNRTRIFSDSKKFISFPSSPTGCPMWLYEKTVSLAP